ncbi:GDSL-type esterase/lipase family protein [Bombilactobacillus folatiphilus]|uniref:GDSL-type esterase/lipase family protein n=1 Tax=Bombilactobacillus folatiphilus TaxID=2923362 RepID=A0ABY4P827_9LACO|nr:GDSL-type esterase/lipase family protein [Bombilactobacillus folatiphilus]UQS81868.1 GDSL-type esterase/lipase family protein [Bombilactobacillus folatiphilus]
MKLQETTANFLDAGLYFSGRWMQTQHGMYTTNLGAQIFTQSQGAQVIKWFFSTKAPQDDTWLAYQIDDQPFQRQMLTSAPLLIELPDTGKHQIRLVYSGNAKTDNVWKRHEGLYFDQVQTSGQLTPVKPVGSPITFIGDSITAGCWVAGPTPGKDYRAESNYAALVAQHFNKEDIRICYAAAGVVQAGAGGVPNAQTFVEQMAFNQPYQPINSSDVIINLGTTDRKVNDNEFRVGFELLLQKIKLQYPTSRLWVMIPFAQVHADIIREEASEYDNTTIVETKDWDLSYTDGLHPNLQGTQVAAQELIAVLQ